jgi:hypothetical protein
MPSAAAIDYAQSAIQNGHEKPWLNWILFDSKVSRAQREAHPFIYGSPYRPSPRVSGDVLIAPVAGGAKAVVFSAKELSLDEVMQAELIPLAGTMGTFIVATAQAMRQPVELAHRDGDKAALIFRNPRGIWQLSHFVDGVGPTGHIEGDDPAKLAYEAWLIGYRTLAQGMVDAIVGNLSGLSSTRAKPMDVLFFIYMPGCHTCAAVKPVVREFRDVHEGKVKVIPVNITEVEWKAQKWIPRVTPTLVKLARDGRRYTIYDGRPSADGQGRIITPDEVKSWLSATFL